MVIKTAQLSLMGQQVVTALARRQAAWGAAGLFTGHCRVCPECQGLAHKHARPSYSLSTLTAHHAQTHRHTHTHTRKSGMTQVSEPNQPPCPISVAQASEWTLLSGLSAHQDQGCRTRGDEPGAAPTTEKQPGVPLRKQA